MIRISDPSTLPERSASEHDPPRPPTLDRYVLLDLIGQGGMGAVYTAFDQKLDRKVAIKVLHHRLAASPASAEAHDRLLREAQAMARLSHPNVVAVHDVGAFEGRVFVAMEYVEGTTLKQWLRGSASLAERLDVLRAAGRGLAAAHAAGLVHRDFKPDNVLVGRDGRVRVTDFGLARGVLVGPASSRSPAAEVTLDERPVARGLLDAPLTETGSILGTVGFMAPEQAYCDETDARADQFSFCATAYVVLYGVKPFPSPDVPSYISSLSAPVAAPPPGARVPAWIRRVLLRGLSHEPQDRFPSMDALLDGLGRDPTKQRRRWIGLVLAALAALAAVIGVRRSLEGAATVCTDGPDRLASVWDAQVRGQARDAFVATGAVDAAGTFERAAKVLDAYAAQWGVAYRASCLAGQAKSAAADDVTRRRAECVERRRVDLRALTSTLREADAQTVSAAVDMAYGLPSTSSCSEPGGLGAGLPGDPGSRAAVEQARASLARAGALQLAGKFTDGLAVAQDALAGARAASHEETEAEALFRVATLQASLGNYALAARTSRDAAKSAVAAGAEVVAVRSFALLAHLLGARLRGYDEARDLLALAGAGVKHMGGNEELELIVVATQAALLRGDHQPELALPYSQQAVHISRRLNGVHPATASALRDLGGTYEELGRDEDALRYYGEALAMDVELYGAGSPMECDDSRAVGDTERKLGRIGEGSLHIGEALETAERLGPSSRLVESLQSASLAALRDGQPLQALALARRALSLSTDSQSPWIAAVSSFLVGDALVASGSASAGLVACDDALAVQEASKDIDPDRFYYDDALRCRGEALLALGRPREALGSLERSVTLQRRGWRGDLALARFALARALVAVGGDGARARSLARQALEELAPLKDRRAEHAAVERWLDAHPDATRGPAR
jgi:tetratricopeptide (TPR) repeat protein/tRNA A-37 threonylcarbamoyl transferase component Bud32